MDWNGETVTALAADIWVFILAAICFVHALRTRSPYLYVMLAGAVYGFFIEWLNMRTTHNYHYEKFMFMLGKTVPLFIVLAWGSIIYAAMTTTDHLRLKWYFAPILDGLLATSIDVSLDPLAVHLNYWTWDVDSKPWFDSPFSNYVGWFLVVYSFSLMIRLAFRKKLFANLGKLQLVVIPFLAIPAAMVPLYIGLVAYYWGLIRILPEGYVFFTLSLLALYFSLRYLPCLRRDAKIDYISVVVPGSLHLFTLVMISVSTSAMNDSALTMLAPAVALMSMLCFSWPYLDEIGKQLPPMFDICEPRDEVIVPNLEKSDD